MGGGGHKIFDDQNVGSRKMTIDIVCLFSLKQLIMPVWGIRCISGGGS